MGGRRLRTFRSAFAGVLPLGARGVVGVPEASAIGSARIQAAPGAADSLQLVTATRVLDTRPTPTEPSATTAIQVTGRGGGGPAEVAAVQLTVTVTGSTEAGYLTVFADGTTRPGTSNLNFSKDQAVANTVTVPVGADGRIAIYNGSPGATQLIVDVAGYYIAGPPTAAGTLNEVTASRVLDTRPVPVAAGATVAAQVSGRDGVPAGVVAVQVTVTAAGSTGSGYLTVYPEGATRPGTSNLNFAEGQQVANTFAVPVGADGKIAIYNGSPGTTPLIIDVTGYCSAGTSTAGGQHLACSDDGACAGHPSDSGHRRRRRNCRGQQAGRHPRGNHRCAGDAHRSRVHRAGLPHREPVRRVPARDVEPELLQGPERGEHLHRRGQRGREDRRLQRLARHDPADRRRHRPLHRRDPGAASNIVGWAPTGTPATSTYGTTSTVTGLSRGITAISGRQALAVDGTVWILAYPGTTAAPQQILGLDHIVALAQGECSYALKSDGTVWAWGENLDGSLEIGNNTRTNQVVQVSGLTGITAIAGGGFHGYALDSHGAVWRRGQDIFGTGNGNEFGHTATCPTGYPA